MEELDQRVGEARELTRERQWGPAALAWVRAANRAMELEEPDAARQAWEAAGEAWRRDDQPAAAVRALQRALGLAGGTPMGASLARVKLAGALGELGRAEAGLELCLTAARDVPEGPVHLTAVDTLVGALQCLGRKEETRPLVAELVDEEEGALAVAGHFRAGQLHRLDGELELAAARFGLVIASLEGEEAAEAGLGAAESELAEVATLQGELQDAVALYSRSVERQRRTGRRALRWRAEAGRVRVIVETGIRPLVQSLDEGIAFAVEREMVLLEADLRIARGMAFCSSDPSRAGLDLDRAIEIGEQTRCPLRTGRARLEKASRLEAGLRDRLEWLRVAEEELGMSLPWTQRARMARAELLAQASPSRARELAAGCAARFTVMGMERDLCRARSIIHGSGRP